MGINVATKDLGQREAKMSSGVVFISEGNTTASAFADNKSYKAGREAREQTHITALSHFILGTLIVNLLCVLG